MHLKYLTEKNLLETVLFLLPILAAIFEQDMAILGLNLLSYIACMLSDKKLTIVWSRKKINNLAVKLFQQGNKMYYSRVVSSIIILNQPCFKIIQHGSENWKAQSLHFNISKCHMNYSFTQRVFFSWLCHCQSILEIPLSAKGRADSMMRNVALSWSPFHGLYKAEILSLKRAFFFLIDVRDP